MLEDYPSADSQVAEDRSEIAEAGRAELKALVLAVRTAIAQGDAVAAAAHALVLGDESFALVVRLYLLGNAIAGRAFREAQARRGKRGAAAKWRASAGVDDLIKRLGRKRDELGDYLKPAELWTEMYAELEREKLRPKELAGPQYKFKGGGITYGAFSRRLQRLRRAT